ncbi:MAG: hypothetical protein F4Z89_12340 [Acidimicrobiaceae bacterium]|nr:hypothetical protein [Acidimicrobiaceae bacterium]
MSGTRTPDPFCGGWELCRGRGRQDHAVGVLGCEALNPGSAPGHGDRHGLIGSEPGQGRLPHRLARQQAPVELERLPQRGEGTLGVHPERLEDPAAAHAETVHHPARCQLGEGGDSRGGGHRMAAEGVGDGRRDGQAGAFDDGRERDVHVAFGALVGHEAHLGSQRLAQAGQLD